MSRSELHNWECAIETLCGDNADKMLAIAQDIYNTAFVRGKNYISLEQQPCEDCVSRDEVLKDQLSVYTKEYGEIDVVAVEYIESLPSVTPSYNSINTELKPCEDVLDEIITQIEQVRDKDRIAEYPYNRCIRIVEEYKNGEG